jgi:hypothetical protein
MTHDTHTKRWMMNEIPLQSRRHKRQYNKKTVTSGPRCMLNKRGIVKSKKMVE